MTAVSFFPGLGLGEMNHAWPLREGYGGKKKVRFPWQDFSREQTRKLGNTNQVKRLPGVFLRRVLQASLSRHSREYTVKSTSSEQSSW